MKKNPLESPPAYEKLVGNLRGFYSRRINIQHRIVFQVTVEPNVHDGVECEGYVKLIRLWTRYE